MYQLKSHIELVHEKVRKYVCDKCGKSYAGFSGLKTHVMGEHGTGDPIKDFPHACTVLNCQKR